MVPLRPAARRSTACSGLGLARPRVGVPARLPLRPHSIRYRHSPGVNHSVFGIGQFHTYPERPCLLLPTSLHVQTSYPCPFHLTSQAGRLLACPSGVFVLQEDVED